MTATAMELTIPAFNPFLPSQSLAAGGVARVAAEQDSKNVSSDERRARAERAPASLEAQKAREETARKEDTNVVQANAPSFVFEYEGTQRIMKVNNQKGALIYQVPSKGQLALIEAEENDASQVRLTA